MKKLRDFFLRLLYAIMSMFVMLEDIDGQDVHQELDYAELLTPGLRKVFYDSFQSVPEVYSRIYNVNKSNKYSEKDFMMGAMAPWTEFGSSTASVSGTNNMPAVPYDTVAKGNIQEYIHKEFAKGFMVERKFIDDEQYGVINKMAADLAHAGRVKVELDAAYFLEDEAFDTATLNRATDECLFAADHVLISSASTYSNKMTAKLGYESLRTAIKLMKKTPDEAGNPIVLIPNKLIVPVDLEDTAKEILKTMKKPGSNENDINTIEGIDIIVNPYFTSATAWFLMDSSRNQLNWFWRVRPFFDRERDFDTLVSKWMGYMRYSFGATDWRGIVGSDGSGAASDTFYSFMKKISDGVTAIDSNTDVPAPTNVLMVKPATFEVQVGGADLTIAALVYPAGANQGITWTSATPAKATISAAGVIHPLEAGTTVIRAAATADPTKYMEATLTVNAAG